MEPLVELHNISLSYGNIRALNHVNFQIYPAEVHALIGEHSAGKTSVAHVLSGLIKPTSGHIIWEKFPFSLFSIKQTEKRGIRIVTQENSLFPGLSVAENFFVKQDRFRLSPFSSRRKAILKVKQYFKHHQIEIDPTMLVKNLSIPDRFFLDIIINLYHPPKLLILDEAFENINKTDLDRIMPVLKQLQKENMAILLITHQVDNIYEFAQKVTILRNGETILTDSVDSIDKINLIQLAYTQISKTPNVTNTNIAFRQLLKYNEAILEHLPLNLFVVDKNNTIQLINNAAKQFFNVSASFFTNMPIESLFLPENEDMGNLICDALAKNSEESFTGVPMTIHEAVHKTDIIIYPIYEGTSKTGSIIMINDITEQETLREQIILSENLASLGLLAAGVAHEINNPLEIIYSCLDHVKLNLENTILTPTIDDITEEINAIAQIVSSLVTFSSTRPDANEVFDVNALLDSMINLVKFSAKKNHILLIFRPSPQPLFVRASKTEIKQVILNMMKNGFEAMPFGGEFLIETQQETRNGAEVAVMVFRDSGAGIKETVFKDLFSPFYSTKSGEKRNLGLGLSVSYGIITKYHGEISVRNRKPTGAEFTISLPILFDEFVPQK